MKVTEKDLIGELKGFPLKVVQKMCEEQVEQGNDFDPTVFQRDIEATEEEGGFDWDETVGGFEYWDHIIAGKYFGEFFESIFGVVDMKVKVKKLVPEAKIPKYAKPGDAGLDLTVTSVEDRGLGYTKYGFGLAFEIPEGHVGLLFPRSSCYKKDQTLSNSVGVIDSQFRGEVSAVMFGRSANKYEVGERAAQLIIMPYPQVELVETEELSETERGKGGFGSTGTK